MKTVCTLLGLMIASTTFAQAPGAGGPNPEQMFQNRDINKDGFLSKQEISGTRMADGFDKLDANKDGKLSPAEVKAGRETMRGQQDGRGPRGEGPEARFKEIDTNKDGFLSKEEFGVRVNQRFDALDTSKDGRLTLDEVKAGGPDRPANKPN